METKVWLMPTYYKSFKCKCDKCRHCCCSSWKIPITQDEYYHLIGMDCSSELHQRLEISFEDPRTPDKSCYKYISFNYLGDCHLNKDGLCLLHSQMGEQYLPKVCKLYPRSLKQINDQCIACCSNSCERVVEMLQETDSLNIIKEEMNVTPNIKYEISQNDFNTIFTINSLMQDKLVSLNERITRVCQIINNNEFNKDINSNIDPIKYALDILERFTNTNHFLSKVINEVITRYRQDTKQYEQDLDYFISQYNNYESFYENLINNSLIYECFPFVDKRIDKINAYKGLCASYGFLKIISVGYYSIHRTNEALIDSIAALYHLIDHTAFYYNINVICDYSAIMLKL